MPDRTREVEIKIEPTELFGIIQTWAAETKFSMYETNEKRTIYSKKTRFNTCWLLAENQGENIKISAWLAPKGMNPDAKGNIWKGYKIPVPSGIAIGPAAVYKKQFNQLMQMIESKSKNFSYITSTTNQPKMSKESAAKGLLFLGIIILLSGVLGILSASSLYMTSSNLQFTKTMLQKDLFDTLLGIITIVCSRLLKNGKALAIWLYGAIIFLNAGYSIFMGYKFPYFIIIFGALIIFQLLELKKQGELA